MRARADAYRLPGWILYVPTFAALLLGILSYQLPAQATIPIGSLGDRLFVDSSEALGAQAEATGKWYGDELGDTGRSRWTRSRARITFPRLGGGAAEMVLRARGWPEDATSEQTQPLVTVRAGGRAPETVVGTFTPVSTSE